MFRHCWKIAWRVIRKQRLYSILNVVGLSVSLTCALVIALHLENELSYESCFPKKDRIYRVRTDSQYGGNFRHWAASAPGLAPMLKEQFPEVESVVRLHSIGNEILKTDPLRGSVRHFEESWGFMADSEVLHMFDLEFIHGEPGTALDGPGKMVITSSMAEKYFGSANPIGQILITESQRPIEVSGVIRDLPSNTHLRLHYLISLPAFAHQFDRKYYLTHPTWKSVYTYVLLRSNEGFKTFHEKAPAAIEEFFLNNNRPGRDEQIRLQPIERIHLHSKLEGELTANSDILYVYVFSCIAVLILLIAAVNFVNLTTAQSFKRMREVGVRKVLGAHRIQLIWQYLGESFLMTLLAIEFSSVLLHFVLPFYNRVAVKTLSLKQGLMLGHLLFFLGLLVLITLLAGLYPSFFISRFLPVRSIKGLKDPHSSPTRIRKALVVFQFIVSIALIFCTITIHRQIKFFQNTELGFRKEGLIAFPVSGETKHNITRDLNVIKSALLNHPDISHVTLASTLPGQQYSNERITPVSVADKNTIPMMRLLRTDEDYINTLELEIVSGRDFTSTDKRSSYLISETAWEMFELEEPLGTICRSDVHSKQSPIVGVFKDFHFASLHQPIEPLIIEYRPDWTQYLLVCTETKAYAEVLDFVKQTLYEVSPGHLFRYEFVDEVFNRNYQSEEKVLDLFHVFSFLAIVVACLGLFGLTVHSSESRIKEIGIRKVLGASIPGIVVMLSREFIQWVLLANLIAWPSAYLIMTRWLQQFAYRIDIGIWVFFVSGVFALAIAVLTVCYQSIKTALVNPVESLKYE